MIKVGIDFMAFSFNFLFIKIIEIEYFVNLFAAVLTKGLYLETGISIASQGVQAC